MRRRITYANVAATLALVFSMTGGALAAHHYLINSTKQINPKVIKALRGKAGPQGIAGKAGTPGGTGVTGKEGQQGKEGPAGQSALVPLPSGQSESGDYGIRTDNTVTEDFIDQSVTFPVQLAAPIASSNVIYTTAPSTSHCSGTGHADRGFLCIYSENTSGVGTPTVGDFEGTVSSGAGKFGFDLEWKVSLADAFDIGTYTLTAP